MANGFPYRASGLAGRHVCIVVPRTCWRTVNLTRPRGKGTTATYWCWPWGQVGRGVCIYYPCLFSLSFPFIPEAACSMTKSNLCLSPTLHKWVELSQKVMFPGDAAEHCFILTSRSPSRRYSSLLQSPLRPGSCFCPTTLQQLPSPLEEN